MSEDLLAGELATIIGDQPGCTRCGQVFGHQLADRFRKERSHLTTFSADGRPVGLDRRFGFGRDIDQRLFTRWSARLQSG